jgi:hypothetical protein
MHGGHARGPLLALFAHGQFVTDDAAAGGAQKGVMARDVTGDAADHRPAEAAGFSGRRRRHERPDHSQAGEEFQSLHDSSPVAAKLSYNICTVKLANRCQPPIFAA